MGLSDPTVTPCQPHKERGVLRTRIEKGSRPGMALLLCGAVLIVPLLLIQNGADAAASPRAASGAIHRGPARAPVAEARSKAAPGPRVAARTRAPDRPRPPSPPAATTTTRPVPVTVVEPVETTAPTQEVADHLVAASVPPTTTPPTTSTTSTTSTTAPPVAGPGPVAPAGPVTEEGQVTYYAHPAGTCASPWLPFGTVVTRDQPGQRGLGELRRQ